MDKVMFLRYTVGNRNMDVCAVGAADFRRIPVV